MIRPEDVTLHESEDVRAKYVLREIERLEESLSERVWIRGQHPVEYHSLWVRDLESFQQVVSTFRDAGWVCTYKRHWPLSIRYCYYIFWPPGTQPQKKKKKWWWPFGG